MKRKKRRRSASGKHGSRVRAYPAEFRLKVVRLFLEEGYSAVLLAEQFGISRSAIQRWVRLYRQQGIEGLEPKPHHVGKTNIHAEVHRRMVAVKTDHPGYGPRRIADVLKQFFLIRTSPSTVHRTLSEQGLYQGRLYFYALPAFEMKADLYPAVSSCALLAICGQPTRTGDNFVGASPRLRDGRTPALSSRPLCPLSGGMEAVG